MERTTVKDIKKVIPKYVDCNSPVIYENQITGDICKVKQVLSSLIDSTKDAYSIHSPLEAALIGEKLGSVSTYLSLEGEINIKISDIQHFLPGEG